MPAQNSEEYLKYLFKQLENKNYSNFIKNILLSHLEYNLKNTEGGDKYIEKYRHIRKNIKEKIKRRNEHQQVEKYSTILKEKTEDFKKNISYSGIEKLKNIILKNVESTKKSFQSDFEEVNTDSIFICITVLFFIVYFILKYY